MNISPIQSDALRPVALLQRIQIMAAEPEALTLHDALLLLHSMQELYGPATTLEQIIQEQVARDLSAQLAVRKTRMEVLHG